LGQSASSQAANSARTAALPRGLMSAKATHCTNTNYSSSFLQHLDLLPSTLLLQKLNAASKARPKKMSTQQAKSMPKQIEYAINKEELFGDHTLYA